MIKKRLFYYQQNTSPIVHEIITLLTHQRQVHGMQEMFLCRVCLPIRELSSRDRPEKSQNNE